MDTSFLLTAAQILQPELSAWRRHLHQYPELSCEEHDTAAFVATELRAMGLEPVTGYAGTHAVVALIQGAQPGPTVALRADMDALPIQELNAVDYVSQHPGVMHACGHDAHTTMLLGATRLLLQQRDQLRGNVRLIFQPAEEASNNTVGATALIQAGLLADPPVDAIFGLHVYPDLPVGHFGTRPGPMMASTDSFEVCVTGQGAHAARPHQGIDPIVIAAQAVSALQQVVSRRVDPLRAVVLTIGWIRGGQAENVIPETVRFGGTVRTLEPDLRAQVPIWMRQILSGLALSHGAQIDLDYRPGSAPVVNQPEATAFVLETLDALVGSDQVQRIPTPSMGGEDFGAYLQVVPGCFFRVGTRHPEHDSAPPLHSPYFDMDERALPLGAAALANLALAWLKRA
ncbi:MAG: M20 metallopeptidase family protein [Candidatus Sericytochromatia bacterium]